MQLAADPIETRCTVSPAKLRANRRNARRSTGPKTRAGKAKVAGNARRHGRTLPVRADPLLARTIDDLAHDIETSVPGARLDVLGHAAARRVAETMLDVRRVRQAKDALLARLDADPGDAAALWRLAALDRYEGCAFARRKRAIRAFDEQVGLRAKATKRARCGKRNDFSDAFIKRPAWPADLLGRSCFAGMARRPFSQFFRAEGWPPAGSGHRSPRAASLRRTAQSPAVKPPKRSQPRKANDLGDVPRPLASPHPEERSRRERVSKDGRSAQAGAHRPSHASRSAARGRSLTSRQTEPGPGANRQNKANCETPMISVSTLGPRGAAPALARWHDACAPSPPLRPFRGREAMGRRRGCGTIVAVNPTNGAPHGTERP